MAPRFAEPSAFSRPPHAPENRSRPALGSTAVLPGTGPERCAALDFRTAAVENSGVGTPGGRAEQPADRTRRRGMPGRVPRNR